MKSENRQDFTPASDDSEDSEQNIMIRDFYRFQYVGAKKRRSPEIVFVTPQFAKKALEKNKNRRLTTKHVNKFCRLIKQGDFRFNGDTISFNTDGELVDGQHRLTAIVKTQIALPMIVIYDLDNEDALSKDQGARRTVAQNLGILRGAGPNSKYSAVIRLMKHGMSLNGGSAIQERIRFLDRHAEIIVDYVNWACRVNLKGWYNSGWVASLCVAAVLYGREKIDPLFKRMVDDKFTHDRDPARLLLKEIQALKMSQLKNNNKVRSVKHKGPNSHIDCNHYAITIAAVKRELSGSLSRNNLKPSLKDYKGAWVYRNKDADADTKNRIALTTKAVEGYKAIGLEQRLLFDSLDYDVDEG